MNSYFEQSGFYGHPHQAAAGMMSAASSGHDQTSAAAAAYRGFPLSLGMSPYANHHLHQTRTAQDSPYDASITAACKQIYDGTYNKDCSKPISGATNGTTTNSGSGSTATNNTTEANGYKDVWNSSGSNGTNQNTAPVRPSACTPDSRVGYIDASGGSPVSRSGSTAASGAWNTNCQIGTTATQSASSASLHQNHTFYPWMAIAGKRYSESLAGTLLPDWIGEFYDHPTFSHRGCCNLSELLLCTGCHQQIDHVPERTIILSKSNYLQHENHSKR